MNDTAALARPTHTRYIVVGFMTALAMVTYLDRACIGTMLLSLKDADRAQLSVPLIAQVSWDGKQHELRVMREADLERGKQIANIFGGLGLELKVIDLTNIWAGARNVRPNTFELWFGDAPLPSVCGTSSARAQ